MRFPGIRSLGSEPRCRSGAAAAAVAGWLLAGAAVASAAPEPLDAQLPRLAGGELRLAELRGGRVLLELWATWCEPCRTQAQILRATAGELDRAGIVVIAVNVGESRRTVERYLADASPHAEVVLDRGQRLAQRLGVGALPALALLREDGTVAAVREGLVSSEALVELLRTSFPGGESPGDGEP